MVDVKAIFERQARWQRSRATLSWTEKLRMAEILREAALAMGGTRQKSSEAQFKQKVRGYRKDRIKGI